ncbi:MAG: tRNA preQ1(34) S-adenosylmethionine ribosyltransferase-isomerase QueA [Treponema sp.]
MRTRDFYFDLPKELIAQYPSPERGNDRLLVLNKRTGAVTDALFSDLPTFLPDDCLMVFNDAKVSHARIYAETGCRQTEFLLIQTVDGGFTWKTLVKRAKRQKEGACYHFTDGTTAMLVSSPETESSDYKYIRFDRRIDDAWLEKYGHIPLPPYIKRGDTCEDAARYQTIYAKNPGSVAAPTAGLHFTQPVLDALDSKHIEKTSVTLNVGLGTFLPVRTEHIEDHKMHIEHFTITDTAADSIEKAYEQKRRIVAVGTTSVRTLESAWNRAAKQIIRGAQTTGIFIYPGFEFSLTDILLTNFHTPESSLVMLVSAFAGKEQLFQAYRYAIEKHYRFFSYGDAMLII